MDISLRPETSHSTGCDQRHNTLAKIDVLTGTWINTLPKVSFRSLLINAFAAIPIPPAGNCSS